MKGLKVRDVKDLITERAAIVKEKSTLKDIADALLDDPKTQVVYVVDADMKLVGLIPIHIITQYAYYEHIPPEYLQFRTDLILGENASATDLMLPPIFVREDDDIEIAFRKMFENRLVEIPVVDSEMRMVGDLHQIELIKAWLDE